MWIESADAVARGVACLTGGAIFVNQLDEAFIDVTYLARRLHRRARAALPPALLAGLPEKRIAILVPAWQEAAVIREMLDHNLATLDYPKDRYDIFCGTYANDPATQARVDEVAEREPGVHKVVVPHDGPTSKADCLNWIYQGVVVEERRRGIRFDILLMHDSEDVIHPRSLRLICALIPGHDFVQTPVFPLDPGLRSWVAGTYLDEFAESHEKELLVREAIGGVVPSAGVGSAFERGAFEEIAGAHGQRPFQPDSLTEDYDIGVKFRLAGKRAHFASAAWAEDTGTGPRPRLRGAVATREIFPSTFAASVRQRSRWILGIALQSWERFGWRGSWAVRYCFWRDRKGLFTNALVLLAYALALYLLLRQPFAGIGGATPFWRPGEDTALRLILLLNGWAFLWRALLKAWFVGGLYGPGHAALAVPRLVVGNAISIVATARAVRAWLHHRLTGEPLRWFKTAHEFPCAEALLPAQEGATPVAAPAQVSGDAAES